MKGGINVAEIQENAIEWYSGDDNVCISLTQKKYINKILRFSKSYSEVKIDAVNDDGSICAHIPLSWIKISPKRSGREYTEDEKQAAAERLRKARSLKNGSTK